LSVSSIDREERARRPELGGHVGDGRAVGEREPGEAVAVELDELADHAVGAEHLGDGEDQVGGRHALGQGVRQLEADDLGDEHVVGLAQGDGLGLYAADAPAEDAEAVDHGGVAVGADEGVGHRDAVLDDDALGEVLEVDLVDDAGGGRHHGEVVEGLLAPLQELVALAVALELALGVELQGRRVAEGVHLDGVVDDEVHRHERVDLLRVPPTFCIALRIAARSTMAGTPVKSCMTTRAGR
jgi:hypothetical protein